MPSAESVEAVTPDEAVLRFVEGELRASGRLLGYAAQAYLFGLERRGVSASQGAALRLAISLYAERIDPSAVTAIRRALERA